jgi:hypothetical protein
MLHTDKDETGECDRARAALGLTPEPIGPRQLREHIRDAVQAFLHAYREIQRTL